MQIGRWGAIYALMLIGPALTAVPTLAQEPELLIATGNLTPQPSTLRAAVGLGDDRYLVIAENPVAIFRASTDTDSTVDRPDLITRLTLERPWQAVTNTSTVWILDSGEERHQGIVGALYGIGSETPLQSQVLDSPNDQMAIAYGCNDTLLAVFEGRMDGERAYGIRRLDSSGEWVTVTEIDPKEIPLTLGWSASRPLALPDEVLYVDFTGKVNVIPCSGAPPRSFDLPYPSEWARAPEILGTASYGDSALVFFSRRGRRPESETRFAWLGTTDGTPLRTGTLSGRHLILGDTPESLLINDATHPGDQRLWAVPRPAVSAFLAR